jgi:hypothetical protein
MAVKAEFTADFQSFYDGVDKADAKLDAFGKTAEKTGGATKQWATAFGAADSVLQQAGVNVGGASKALDEMSNAAGKSVAQLGAVASGALLVGTAMAAWNFGRAIAGWLDLDKSISQATAKLMNWGDLAAQTAGAKQDTINLAISKGAAATIDYAGAIAYLTEKNKERLKGLKEEDTAHTKTLEAMKELNSAGVTWQATLDGVSGSVVEAVKYYLAAGVSQGDLATAYGLTATQVKAVAESMKAAEEADKAWLEGMKAAAAEAEIYADVLRHLATDGIDAMTAANERAIAKLTAKTDAVTASILAEDRARATLAQSVTGADALTQAWTTMQTALATLQKEKVGDIDTTARQQVIWNDYTAAVEKATAAQAQAPAALDATTAATTRATQAAGVYMNQLHMLVDDPNLAAFFGGGPQGSAATTLYSGGQAGITPEMAAAMAAGQFIQSAGVGVVHNTFNVNGTAQDAARQIADILNRTVMQGRKVTGS